MFSKSTSGSQKQSEVKPVHVAQNRASWYDDIFVKVHISDYNSLGSKRSKCIKFIEQITTSSKKVVASNLSDDDDFKLLEMEETEIKQEEPLEDILAREEYAPEKEKTISIILDQIESYGSIENVNSAEQEISPDECLQAFHEAVGQAKIAMHEAYKGKLSFDQIEDATSIYLEKVNDIASAKPGTVISVGDLDGSMATMALFLILNGNVNLKNISKYAHSQVQCTEYFLLR